jgi:hypothetical protein
MDYYFRCFFVILCFEISFNNSSDPFLKFVLLMFCIVIFHRIMSTFMDCRHDKLRIWCAYLNARYQVVVEGL